MIGPLRSLFGLSPLVFSDGADTVDCDVVSLVNKPTPSTVAGRLAAALHGLYTISRAVFHCWSVSELATADRPVI